MLGFGFAFGAMRCVFLGCDSYWENPLVDQLRTWVRENLSFGIQNIGTQYRIQWSGSKASAPQLYSYEPYQRLGN
jgi:hypothetical protein